MTKLYIPLAMKIDFSRAKAFRNRNIGDNVFCSMFDCCHFNM